MNAAFVAVHANPGMQLNPVYSLGGALLGTALVCALLLWAFTRSLPIVPAQLMQLSLVAVPQRIPERIPQAMVRTPPPERLPQPFAAKPLVLPKARPLGPVNLPALLDLSLPGSEFAPPAASPFVPHVFNPYADLSKALAAPPPPATMHDGDSWRSIYGFTMAQAGGQCLALQNIQVGPSPSARATVGFGVPCPGNYRPSMAQQLAAWAARHSPEHH